MSLFGLWFNLPFHSYWYAWNSWNPHNYLAKFLGNCYLSYWSILVYVFLQYVKMNFFYFWITFILIFLSPFVFYSYRIIHDGQFVTELIYSNFETGKSIVEGLNQVMTFFMQYNMIHMGRLYTDTVFVLLEHPRLPGKLLSQL